ncbi:hypothetical protein Fmac_020301 [Flemingia macrophylla]|uniref:Uncharacterized protein n=1 Tax=Flemingia macrophylla TaxID=520843 RepID=A0ABD1LTM0_9FABA
MDAAAARRSEHSSFFLCRFTLRLLGPPFTCLASLASPSLASSSTSTSPSLASTSTSPSLASPSTSPHLALHPSPLRRPPPSPSTLYSCRLPPSPLHRLQRIIVSDTQVTYFSLAASPKPKFLLFPKLSLYTRILQSPHSHSHVHSPRRRRRRHRPSSPSPFRFSQILLPFTPKGNFNSNPHRSTSHKTLLHARSSSPSAQPLTHP